MGVSVRVAKPNEQAEEQKGKGRKEARTGFRRVSIRSVSKKQLEEIKGKGEKGAEDRVQSVRGEQKTKQRKTQERKKEKGGRGRAHGGQRSREREGQGRKRKTRCEATVPMGAASGAQRNLG